MALDKHSLSDACSVSDMNYGDRLRTALAYAKKERKELGQALEISVQAVGDAIRGKTKAFTAENNAKAAAFLRVNAHWLATGEGDMLETENHVIHKVGDGAAGTYRLQNVTSAAPRRSVPLISWVNAGAFAEVEDMYRPGEADQWVEAYDSQPSDNAFALKVEGDSMTSPHPGDLSFPAGTVLIVDPNRSATAGDYVIAKDVLTQQATFKKLTHDGGRWYLKPLNPAYPVVQIDDPAVRVIGRVIEYRIGGKL